MMAKKSPDISTVLNDPEYWLHRYEEDSDAFRYIHVPRELHRNLTFITDEHLPNDIETHSFSRRDISQFQPKTGPIHFIFHSAYCCSTMLARAFDVPGTSMGLKEPQVLNDMIGWRRRGAEPRNVAAVTDHALKMMARPFASEESLVIKSSNIVNPLASMMMAMHPDSKALLLYAPIKSYLQSIAKKEMWGRKWVRDVLVGTAKDGFLIGGMSAEELLQLTDLQVAALGWLSQHNLFNQILETHGKERVKFLDSDTFLANQRSTIEHLFAHFGLNADSETVDDIVGGPAFTTHSKGDGEFDAIDRQKEQIQMAELHGEEISMVAEWTKAVAQSQNIQMEPASALLAS